MVVETNLWFQAVSNSASRQTNLPHMNTLLMSKLHRRKAASKQQQDYLLHQGTVHTNAAVLTSIFTSRNNSQKMYFNTHFPQCMILTEYITNLGVHEVQKNL
jgi:hypothetical protein